ncbi:MAG: hypothetical protein JWN62_2516 [Acidimicrobiales bacterium]|nr:hypothetical protein [Acidimicrobiales bacterium]
MSERSERIIENAQSTHGCTPHEATDTVTIEGVHQ